ncbi:MAG: Fe-S cluster assembly protein SufD [Chloroflexi bacterium]|nr:Fe-S cluster assembly protein SufD [Chloroflexota bacterium]
MSSASGPVPPVTARRVGFSQEHLDDLPQRRDEPAWLREQRQAAWDVYQQTPWPTGKEEAWRRFDLRAVQLQLEAVTPAREPGYQARRLSDLPSALQAALGKEDEAVLVLHHGGAVYRAADLPAGVVFTSLEEAVRTVPELVREHLGGLIRPEHGIFPALNAACWTSGALLVVPAGVSLERPVRVLHWADGSRVGVLHRTLVVLERGARATVIDDSLSTPQASGLDLSAVELIVGEGAQLQYLALQDWGRGLVSLNHLRGAAGRDARIAWLVVTLGSRLARSELTALLDQPGGTHQLRGLFFGDDSQHFDLHTLQVHQAPHTTSDLLFKGVLKDSARSAYAGLIRVERGAQRTDAYLANRNLLLSKTARADSIPTLEIEANDVRCTHGATVGPIEEDQVFYLMARGIPRREAERMIVEGFFEPLLAQVPLAHLRRRLERAIARKMEEGE